MTTTKTKTKKAAAVPPQAGAPGAGAPKLCQCERQEAAPEGADCTKCGLKIPGEAAQTLKKVAEVSLKPKVDTRLLEEQPPMPEAQAIAESRKALLHPLMPGQRFFESPKGRIIVAEATKSSIWCDEEKCHINPHRTGKEI